MGMDPSDYFDCDRVDTYRYNRKYVGLYLACDTNHPRIVYGWSHILK